MEVSKPYSELTAEELAEHGNPTEIEWLAMQRPRPRQRPTVKAPPKKTLSMLPNEWVKLFWFKYKLRAPKV